MDTLAPFSGCGPGIAISKCQLVPRFAWDLVFATPFLYEWHTVRWFIPILILLALVTWFGATIESTSFSTPADLDWRGQFDREQNAWRQTAQGWQRADSWRFEESEIPVLLGAQVHPMVIAMLQLLISLGALLAYPCTERRSVA